jgi:hypothetical protein
MAMRLSKLLVLIWCICVPACDAFLVPRHGKIKLPEPGQRSSLQKNQHVMAGTFYAGRSETQLGMYNLPPSGGGGGGNGIREILTSLAGLVLLVAFFASPLGGLFFAVVNSFFLASLILPIILWIAFQGWLFLNTVEGPCPQCGAPVRVAKQDESPSICLNCGTFVQVTPDKSSVDFYREEDQVIVDEGYTASIWDSLLGGPMSAPTTRSGSRSSSNSPEERQARFKREQKVIDVDIIEDEK